MIFRRVQLCFSPSAFCDESTKICVLFRFVQNKVSYSIFAVRLYFVTFPISGLVRGKLNEKIAFPFGKTVNCFQVVFFRAFYFILDLLFPLFSDDRARPPNSRTTVNIGRLKIEQETLAVHFFRFSPTRGSTFSLGIVGLKNGR